MKNSHFQNYFLPLFILLCPIVFNACEFTLETLPLLSGDHSTAEPPSLPPTITPVPPSPPPPPPPPPPPAAKTVTVNTNIRYQTMNGWEASSGAIQWFNYPGATMADFHRDYLPGIRDAYTDLAANELGIDRIRLEVPNSTENPRAVYNEYINGLLPDTGVPQSFRCLRYQAFNDDNNPNTLNLQGFHFDQMDISMDHVVMPLRSKLMARGERLWINAEYISFIGQSVDTTEGCPATFPANFLSHAQFPNEYAEFVLAVYQHMQTKYGVVPDSWEVILEPDNASTNISQTYGWSASRLADVAVATANRLTAAGFNPRLILPSNEYSYESLTWFQGFTSRLNSTIGSSAVQTFFDDFVEEIAFHRYDGPTVASLNALRDEAALYNLKTSSLEDLGARYEDIHLDLKEANVSSFQRYSLGAANTAQANYIFLDTTDPLNLNVSLKWSAYEFRQYYKYVRLNAVRVGATTNDSATLDPIVFENTDGRLVTVVKTMSAATFSVLNLPAGLYGAYYTASRVQPQRLGIALPDQMVTAGGAPLTVTMPYMGVVTIYKK